ncbi:DUF975 family protein [Pseudolactococcus reticulitermitis]|uniref:Integral membrane protein n=1 Tax=Pseudolactococcus reticulitermitis TaxID=2025039 RepID=A0A224XCT0_9LACT|nr:DUF975 family protein [Lactococcus reticulitermitis]GAX47944.1 hypothetical protein RsY01_1557 [Lactococcus reticulitermitis]
MTSSELKQAAKLALKDNFITKMLLFIVPLALSILTSRFDNSYTVVLQHRLNDSNVDFSNAFSNVDWGIVLAIAIPIILVGLIISFLITVIVTAFTTASMFNYIEIFRGEKEDINLSKDILRTFNDNSFWKIAILTLIQQLILFLLMFIPIIGWAIAINLGFAWSQATYVLYDKLKNNQYQGIWDVLNTSKEMMKGYKFKYFLFNLTFIGWYILGAFFWRLPQIWTMPYTEMSMVAFYEARIQNRL